MKKIIDRVDLKNHVFYCKTDGMYIGFYLTKRLSKTFIDYLNPKTIVEFELTGRRKVINKRWCYQVAYFNKIQSIDLKHTYYDLILLRHEMKNVLNHYEYYLFIDFEMTMPGYRQKIFTPELIQAGYVLSKANEKIIVKDSMYIKPKLMKQLSKRTLKFLKIDPKHFDKKAVDYKVFYKKLKRLIKKYHPKFVVWGKNDITVLDESYKIHKKVPLTNAYDFVDLLKLHKDYYNLKNDLGLFKAYKTYYETNDLQKHDAYDDALVTKHVFDAFLDYMT